MFTHINQLHTRLQPTLDVLSRLSEGGRREGGRERGRKGGREGEEREGGREGEEREGGREGKLGKRERGQEPGVGELGGVLLLHVPMGLSSLSDITVHITDNSLQCPLLRQRDSLRRYTLILSHDMHR